MSSSGIDFERQIAKVFHYPSKDRMGRPIRRRPVMEKFWDNVCPEPNSGCWLWMGQWKGPGRRNFYGRFMLTRDIQLTAHRVSWMLHHGPIPDGLHVLHKCDVPPCVNPDHLFLGTNAENAADRARKGRSVTIPRPGVKHHNAKITDNDVREIRHLAADGMKNTTIAKRFGLGGAQVSRIVTRKRWKHVA